MAVTLRDEDLPIERHALGAAGRAAAWNACNTLFLRLSSILVTAAVLHVVSPRDFGVFAVAAAVHAVVSSSSELGLSSALARHDVKPEKAASTVAAISIASSTCLAVGMLVAAPALADALGAPPAASSIRILSVCVFLSGVFAVPTGMALRNLQQRRMFVANAAAFVPSTALLAVLAFHGSGALAFAWSRVLGTVIVGAVLIAWERRWTIPRFHGPTARAVLAFGVPFAGANFLNYFLLNADYAIVGRQFGVEQVGLYMLAFNIASWPTAVLGAAINSVGIPTFSSMGADNLRLARVIRRALLLASLIAFPMSALILALRTPILLVMYGDRWAASSLVLGYLAIYGALFVLALLMANVLSGLGRAKTLFGLQVVWLVSLVSAMTVGAKVDGPRGVAAAHVVCLVCVVIPAYLWAVSRVEPSIFMNFVRVTRRPLLGAVVCTAVAGSVAALDLLSPLAALVLGAPAGLLAYLAVVAPALPEVLPQRTLRLLVMVPLVTLLIRRQAVSAPLREAGREAS